MNGTLICRAEWRGLSLTLMAILSLCGGCAPYPGMTTARFGAPSAGTNQFQSGSNPVPASTPAPTYFPGGPPPPRATITLRLGGVIVYPPVWLPEADREALGVAVEEYLRDAEVDLGWKLPMLQFGRPLVLVLHDDQARTFVEYDAAMRLALLRWPNGPSGFPVAERILPDIGRVLAEEHRIDTGRAMRGFDADEDRVILEARRWPVRIMTVFPWLYQP